MNSSSRGSKFDGLLEALERCLRKKDLKRGERLLESLRRVGREAHGGLSVLEEENQRLRLVQESQEQRLGKLKAAFEDIVATYQASLATFSKFRKAIRIVQMTAGFQDFPEMLQSLRSLFSLQAANLILDEDRFGAFVREHVDTRRLDEHREMLDSVFDRRGVAGSVYIGRVDALEAPSLLLGERVYFSEAKVREGSCFVYRLPNKLAPESPVGLLVFCDADPERYVKSKATDYLELFGDVLAGAVVDMAEQIKAQALRDDMERITRHDLKNPLNSVIGIPQLLLADANLSDDQRELVAVLQKSGYIMLDMINLSTDLYRMEAGTYELSPVAVDVVPLVQRTLVDQRVPIRDMDLSAGITVRGQPPAEAEPFAVSGEKLLCYSMLANLVRNAVEASPRGGRVDIALEEGDGFRLVRIHNQGAPPPEVRDRFFEKYVTAGKRNGSGLGTYSAMLIARTLGGAISMSASDELGSTLVEVRLPPAQA
ncbi:MAG: ATP-binding protein [Desulfovibrionaceae bacterium]